MNTNFDYVPTDMQKYGWNVWDGKTKRPRIPGGSYAKPHQCRPFQECVSFAQSRGWGIGIQMASVRGLVGIDLDGCKGEEWANEIVRRADTVVFDTQSGTGLRLFVRGRFPRGREWAHPDGREHHGFGIYPGGQSRFLTIGPHVSGELVANQSFLDWMLDTFFKSDVARVNARVEDLKKISASYERNFPDNGLIPFLNKQRDKWGKLWKGDWTDYPSQSEADLALATHLCFEYIGPNPQRLETLMCASGLCRDKWLTRDDYRDNTIDKAIQGYLASPVFVSDLVRAHAV